MATPSTSFGQRVRALRLERGLAQDDVARALGVRPLSYGRWERDQQHPGLENRIALARFFEVDIAQLTDADTAQQLDDWAIPLTAVPDLTHLERRVAAMEQTLAACTSLLARIANQLAVPDIEHTP